MKIVAVQHNEKFVIWAPVRLQLHGAIYRPDSFV